MAEETVAEEEAAAVNRDRTAVRVARRASAAQEPASSAIARRSKSPAAGPSTRSTCKPGEHDEPAFIHQAIASIEGSEVGEMCSRITLCCIRMSWPYR